MAEQAPPPEVEPAAAGTPAPPAPESPAVPEPTSVEASAPRTAPAEPATSSSGSGPTEAGAPPPPAPNTEHQSFSPEQLQQLANLIASRPPPYPEPQTLFQAITWFASSGVFFMLVGAGFLAFAYNTMGQIHSAMSFVFVVVGVAILLYGTGTQGIGQFDSGENAEKVARYKVALAGGAGVLAFCVAAGIIAKSQDIKSAFQIEQRYLRFHIKGHGYQADDIGRYIPDIRINGNPVPAVRRGDYIEVYAPYILTREPARFNIRAKLRLIEELGGLLPAPDADFVLMVDSEGNITDGDSASPNGKYSRDSGYDFPWYVIKQPIKLDNTEFARVEGFAPK